MVFKQLGQPNLSNDGSKIFVFQTYGVMQICHKNLEAIKHGNVKDEEKFAKEMSSLK